MANDRLFLVHWPTKTAIYLGKHMGHEWYDAPEDVHERLESLYDMMGVEWEPDLRIVREDEYDHKKDGELTFLTPADAR